MKQELPRLLTPGETASLLGIKVGTLACWRTSQRYPLKFHKVGRSVRYKLDDVLAFLHSCKGGEQP